LLHKLMYAHVRVKYVLVLSTDLGYARVRLGEISTYLDHRVARPGRPDGLWFAVRRGLGACLIILVSEPLYVIPTRMVPARVVVLE
jgi:hypothetical protein